MARKVLMKGLPINIPDLEYPCPIFIFNKETKNPIVLTIDVYTFSPGFMLQMYFPFLNVEIIRGFTLNFMSICSATSHPFEFPSRNKSSPPEILKLLVTLFRNQDNFFHSSECTEIFHWQDILVILRHVGT